MCATRVVHECIATLIRPFINDTLLFLAGATPLYYAAQGGHKTCLEHLLSPLGGGGANHRISTYTGVTPLMVAAQCGHAAVVTSLLTLCDGDDVMHQSDDGATVYHMAASTS